MGIVCSGLLLFSFFIVIIYQRYNRKYNKLPPGPPSLPILGSIRFLKREKGNADAMLDKSFHKFRHVHIVAWKRAIDYDSRFQSSQRSLCSR